jgi:hypothetical protein
MLALVRGALAIVAAALTLLGATAPAQAQQPPQDALRLYVIVVDSLDPDEVNLATPTLAYLKSRGTWYSNSLAVLPSSTVPNFAAMATGVLPQQSGIVSNSYLTAGGAIETMNSPGLWQADHFVTRLERDCGTQVDTGTFFGWEHLYRLFSSGGTGGQRAADENWAPSPQYPIGESALDASVMDALLDWLGRRNPAVPSFVFVELVDVDNSGHADPSGAATGGALPGFRRFALTDTDVQLARFVAALKSRDASGRRPWDSTVLILTSDHSMDWAGPEAVIRLSDALAAAGFTPGQDFRVAPNGGYALVYATGDASPADLLAAVRAVPGVDFALSRGSSPSLADYGLDDANTGDIGVFAEQGRRFVESSEELFLSGQHGHPPTQPSTLLVTGGHPALAAPQVVGGDATTGGPPRGPGTLSVAPTVAELFGLPPGDVPFAAAPLDEAFASAAAPVCSG